MAQVVFNAGLVNGLSLEMEQKEIIAKRRLIDNNSEEELFTWGKTVKVCKCCAWIQVMCARPHSLTSAFPHCQLH